MLVTQEIFPLIMKELSQTKILAIDTETTGLRPWHGDRLFSIIIADAVKEYYFDFNDYIDHEGSKSATLPRAMVRQFRDLLLEQDRLWVLHNAKYDMAILRQEDLELAGEIYCCRVQGRVTQNDLFQYNLNALLKPLGLAKDDAVKKYVEENKLAEKIAIPGKKTKEDVLHYERVPLRIMQPYAEMDARGTYELRLWQIRERDRRALDYPMGAPTLINVSENELKLTKAVFNMEKRGVLIDRDYCQRAITFESDRYASAGGDFERITGRSYSASAKLFSEVFVTDRDRWEFTDKGNPSFSSDVIKYFQSPAAKAVQTLRDAKAKMDFYYGFLYHADADGVIHPNFNIDGTGTGRFSSSEPNLQNLSAEEDEDQVAQEFIVRRAIIPRPGYMFIMPDYNQMEYRQMLDVAKSMQIAELASRGINSWGKDYFKVADLVSEDYDVHKATAEMAGITRGQAKTLNFALLYGAGTKKVAWMLGVSEQEARVLKQKYFAALPYIESLISKVTSTAKYRGWIRNWMGRRYDFKDPNFSYKGTNFIVQGGCADVVKVAMVEIDEYLRDKKSKMVLSIHDEIPCEVHESEMFEVPQRILKIMESIYPFKHVPLTAGMEYSFKSLGDKIKGYPSEARNAV